jgi:CheY-like chemotaxis protein
VQDTGSQEPVNLERPMQEKILVVDDEPQVLEGIERLLHPDFRIDTATSGGEALAKLRDGGPYAVVVCDMRMPEMDGIQLLGKIKVKFPEVIRLMLTGNTDQPTAMRAVNEGNVFRFLVKPCDEDLLKRELNAALVQYRVAAFHERHAGREQNLSSPRLDKAQQVGTNRSRPEIGQDLRDQVTDGTISLPSTEGSIYVGEVIAEDADHLLQSITSKKVIAHAKNRLDRMPKVAEKVKIAYNAGIATVTVVSPPGNDK